jgi:hypothetical protein
LCERAPFGDKPGCLVVVAEDYLEDQALKARPWRILTEKEALPLNDLFRHYQEFREQFKAGPWVGDPSNTPMMQHFRRLGQESRRGFALLKAPHFDDPKNLACFSHLILDFTQENRKTFHFASHNLIRGYVLGLPKEELERPASHHPSVAALGYVLSYLYLTTPQDKFTKEEPGPWPPSPPMHNSSAQRMR